MVRLLTKQEGEDITAFKPAVSIGNMIPTSTVANNVVVSDGQGHVQDSGVSIDSIDALTLGGKSAESYIQSNPNLLVNGDFKLNTQGVTSRSTDGYICDGWTADIDANTNVTWNEDGSVTIDLTNAAYSGEIYQLVEAFTNDEMIMSAEINDVKYSVSGTNGNFSKYISVDGKTIAWLGCAVSNNLLKYRLFAYAGYKVTFKNAKLEIGSVATPFTPTNTYEEYVKIYGTQHLSNPNLLINGDFRVNQRGQTTYGVGKSVDVWGVQGNTSIVRLGNMYDGYIVVQQSVASTSYKDNNGIYQWVDAYHGGNVVTLSAKIDSVVYSATFVLSTSTYKNKVFENDSIIMVAGASASNLRGLVEIQFKDTNEHTIRYVKLEIGNVATPYSPRPYGEEFALCQRYLQLGNLHGLVTSYNANIISFFVPLTTTMREKPTLIGTPNVYENGYVVVDNSGTTLTGFTFNVQGFTNNGIYIFATKNGHGLTPTNCEIRFNGLSGFSAEL